MNWPEAAEGKVVEGKVTQEEVDRANAKRLGKTFKEFNEIKKVIGLMQTHKKWHLKENCVGGGEDRFD